MKSVQSSPYGLVILAALQDRVARVSRRVNRRNAK